MRRYVRECKVCQAAKSETVAELTAFTNSILHPSTAIIVALPYLNVVFKLHEWPRSVVSDSFFSKFFLARFSLFAWHAFVTIISISS